MVYTSAPKADTSDMKLVAEHRPPSGCWPSPACRTRSCATAGTSRTTTSTQAIAHGLFGAAGEGRISGATRADYAEAAASALVGDGHAGRVYELGGEAFTLAELAAEISRQSGQEVTYTDLGEQKYAEFLESVGLAAPHAAILADSDAAAARGALFVGTADLEACWAVRSRRWRPPSRPNWPEPGQHATPAVCRGGGQTPAPRAGENQ